MSYIFSNNTSKPLAAQLAKKLNFKIGKYTVGKNPDDEILVQLNTDVTRKTVYVIGSTNPPAENLLEILLLINNLKVNKAKKIIAIIPYFAYAKADHIKTYGQSLSAKFIANAFKLAGATQIITIDIHSKNAEKFFKLPVTNLSAAEIFASYIKKLKLSDIAAVSPDLGGLTRAKLFAKQLNVKDIIILQKFRPDYKTAVVKNVMGNPKNKNCVIFDDMTQTGTTLINAADELKKLKANNVFVCCTHLIPTGPAIQKLANAKSINQVIITNSVNLSGLKLSTKFKVLKIEKLLIRALYKMCGA